MHINKFNIIFLAYFGMLTLTLIDTYTYVNLRNFTGMLFNVYAVMTVIKIPCTYILKINKLFYGDTLHISAPARACARLINRFETRGSQID